MTFVVILPEIQSSNLELFSTSLCNRVALLTQPFYIVLMRFIEFYIVVKRFIEIYIFKAFYIVLKRFI